MTHKRGERCIDLQALLRRAQGMPVNSTPINNDIERPGLTRTTQKREEQMAQIITLQHEQLVKINAELILLRSGFGHIDTKVEKVQADLTALQARSGNDAGSSQAELGVQNQGSKDKIMIDEGGELSSSDESEDSRCGERVDDRAAYRSLCSYLKSSRLTNMD